jgi:hypothetical protein
MTTHSEAEVRLSDELVDLLFRPDVMSTGPYYDAYYVRSGAVWGAKADGTEDFIGPWATRDNPRPVRPQRLYFRQVYPDRRAAR